MVTENTQIKKQVMGALENIFDPELGANIVELKMLKEVSIDKDLNVNIYIGLTTAKCPLRNKIKSDILSEIEKLEIFSSLKEINVITAELSAKEKSALMDKARQIAQNNNSVNIQALSNTRIFAVSSGKGGVGKSSVTANLGLCLANKGYNVGILDADIWGFSIPRIMGVSGNLKVKDKKILPIKSSIGKGTISVISMGFLAKENSAIMWRGLILNRAVQHFLEDVAWKNLHYLIIDMPPGTGDIQMGLAKMLPKTEVLLVTTPSDQVSAIASRVAEMATKSNIKTVGVIENMSYFQCDHNKKYYLFGRGGGKKLAQTLGVPLLVQIPIENHLADSANIQHWTRRSKQNTNIQYIFNNLANKIEANFPYVELQGCTAKILQIFDNLDETIGDTPQKTV
jgi:ATP-binding protein involved in chromosome partitioning